jgi:hypothetical protein
MAKDKPGKKGKKGKTDEAGKGGAKRQSKPKPDEGRAYG